MADNKGKRVKVHYVGTFDDGEEFDSSFRRGEPVEFVCMRGEMIAGFDEVVREMEIGEVRVVHIPCEKAYGARNEALILKIRTEDIHDAEKLPIGKMVCFDGPTNQAIPMKVIAVEDDMVTFDVNHEMAGKDLNFEITLLDAWGQPFDETKHGG